jgi:hypothetical protein
VGWNPADHGDVREQPNLEECSAQPTVRVAVGSTGDVLIVDATATIVAVTDIDPGAAEGYAQASGNDPRSVPGFTYIQLAPEGMQVWKGAQEFAGRTVMRHGVWLDRPMD